MEYLTFHNVGIALLFLFVAYVPAAHRIASLALLLLIAVHIGIK